VTQPDASAPTDFIREIIDDHLKTNKLKFRNLLMARGYGHDGQVMPGQFPDIVEKGFAFLLPSLCPFIPLIFYRQSCMDYVRTKNIEGVARE